MALCEDESCGLARVTSDDRILQWPRERAQLFRWGFILGVVCVFSSGSNLSGYGIEIG